MIKRAGETSLQTLRVGRLSVERAVQPSHSGLGSLRFETPATEVTGLLSDVPSKMVCAGQARLQRLRDFMDFMDFIDGMDGMDGMDGATEDS